MYIVPGPGQTAPRGQIGQWLDMVYLPPSRGNFVDHDFLEASCLASFFCNMLGLWQWKGYRVTAHYICYLSKDINLTLNDQKLEFM